MDGRDINGYSIVLKEAMRAALDKDGASKQDHIAAEAAAQLLECFLNDVNRIAAALEVIANRELMR